MAVAHGSAADVYLNGYNAGCWSNSITFNMSREIHDSTNFCHDGTKSHTADLTEATCSLSGFYNYDTVTDADSGDYALATAFSAAASGSNLLYFPAGGDTVGDRGWAFTGDMNSYNIMGPVSGITSTEGEFTASVGKRNVKLLAPLAARVNTFTGTSLDNTTSTANGGVGYLHVTSFTSGSIPVLIEHSTDNSVWSTLITFTAVTATHQSERIAVSGTVNRYVRASATGTYSGTFIVAFHRTA